MADRLCACRDEETLLSVKKDILRDYRDIYVYDVNHAEFPEPIGRFDSRSSQMDFISNRILLQDFGLYLGNTFLKFHRTIYDKYKKLSSMIERGLAIALQNRLLYKKLADLCEKIKCQKLLRQLDQEEESCVRSFMTLNESLIFPAPEDQIMGKMYDLLPEKKSWMIWLITGLSLWEKAEE